MRRSIAIAVVSFVIVVVIVASLAVRNLTPDKQAELIFTFISNLFGTIIGGLLAYLIALSQFRIQSNSEAKQRRIDTAFDFHRELVSVELTQARGEANKLFTNYITARDLDDFYSSLPADEKRPIQMVLSFFRRLQLAVEYNRVDKDLVRELLSGEFLEWYHKWFDHIVPTRWDSRKQMDKLHEWIKQELSNTEYEWRRRDALESRNKLLSRTNSGNC